MQIMNSGLVTNRLKAINLPSARSSWGFPPEFPVIGSDEVQVWLVRLDEEKAAEFEEMLSDDERARAERFRFQPQRRQFIAARGFLRIILGKYLKISPAEVRFENSIYGKPSICGAADNKIRFNLSHSDGLAIYAVTSEREIGIDLERLQPFLLDERTIFECLTLSEITQLRTLPMNLRENFFFDCWTRKESYLKAIGKGLMLPPNQIETSLYTESAEDFKTENKPGQARWLFQNLPPIPEYAAALVVEGSNIQSSFWLFPEAKNG